MLEEITVTAQKRSESLQRVPLSVAALTDTQLAQLTSGGDDIRLLSGRVNLYSRVARGYHGGVISGQAMFDPLQKADPETVTSYEAG